jgi:hypothetical protein
VNFFSRKALEKLHIRLPHYARFGILKKIKKIRKALDSGYEVPAPVFLNAPETVPIISFIGLS